MRTPKFLFGRCLRLALALLAVAAGHAAAQKPEPADPVAVTAVDLTKAYGDTTEGNKAYYNKTLVVEGKIIQSTTIVGAVLFLEGYKAPKEKETCRVMCLMKPGIKASDFKVGDTVKVQGKCKGNGSSSVITVDMGGCEVVK